LAELRNPANPGVFPEVKIISELARK